ncbi:MAG: hypothetical protein LBD20_07145 [Spirochaetaceae bacterium]|jgi:hypothetical protein|nr:hypothetical protein [Spirochaetaceae bacterium]
MLPLFACAFFLSQAVGVFAQDVQPPPPQPASSQTVVAPENALPPPQNEPDSGILPLLQDRALVLNISARIIDASGAEMWKQEGSKVTLPGKPVGLQVQGGNIVCTVQFTPYVMRNGKAYLVALGQVWLELPGDVLHSETILKKIPLEFSEPVYFFPLGSEKKGDAQLEICVNMNPFNKNFGKRPRREHHQDFRDRHRSPDD